MSADLENLGKRCLCSCCSEDDSPKYHTTSQTMVTQSMTTTPIDDEGRCLCHPIMQLLRRSTRTGEWMVLLESCPMCVVDGKSTTSRRRNEVGGENRHADTTAARRARRRCRNPTPPPPPRQSRGTSCGAEGHQPRRWSTSPGARRNPMPPPPPRRSRSASSGRSRVRFQQDRDVQSTSRAPSSGAKLDDDKKHAVNSNELEKLKLPPYSLQKITNKASRMHNVEEKCDEKESDSRDKRSYQYGRGRREVGVEEGKPRRWSTSPGSRQHGRNPMPPLPPRRSRSASCGRSRVRFQQDKDGRFTPFFSTRSKSVLRASPRYKVCEELMQQQLDESVKVTTMSMDLNMESSSMSMELNTHDDEDRRGGIINNQTEEKNNEYKDRHEGDNKEHAVNVMDDEELELFPRSFQNVSKKVSLRVHCNEERGDKNESSSRGRRSYQQIRERREVGVEEERDDESRGKRSYQHGRGRRELGVEEEDHKTRRWSTSPGSRQHGRNPMPPPPPRRSRSTCNGRSCVRFQQVKDVRFTSDSPPITAKSALRASPRYKACEELMQQQLNERTKVTTMSMDLSLEFSNMTMMSTHDDEDRTGSIVHDQTKEKHNERMDPPEENDEKHSNNSMGFSSMEFSTVEDVDSRSNVIRSQNEEKHGEKTDRHEEDDKNHATRMEFCSIVFSAFNGADSMSSIIHGPNKEEHDKGADEKLAKDAKEDLDLEFPFPLPPKSLQEEMLHEKKKKSPGRYSSSQLRSCHSEQVRIRQEVGVGGHKSHRRKSASVISPQVENKTLKKVGVGGHQPRRKRSSTSSGMSPQVESITQTSYHHNHRQQQPQNTNVSMRPMPNDDRASSPTFTGRSIRLSVNHASICESSPQDQGKDVQSSPIFKVNVITEPPPALWTLSTIMDDTNEFDPTTGRCIRHPQVRLRKKKLFGKGWKVLKSACPDCCMIELQKMRLAEENTLKQVFEKEANLLSRRISDITDDRIATFDGPTISGTSSKMKIKVGPPLTSQIPRRGTYPRDIIPGPLLNKYPIQLERDEITASFTRSERSNSINNHSEAKNSDDEVSKSELEDFSQAWQENRGTMHVRQMRYTDPENGQSGIYTGHVNSHIVPHGRGVMEYDPNPKNVMGGMGTAVVLLVKDGEWKDGMFDEELSHAVQGNRGTMHVRQMRYTDPENGQSGTFTGHVNSHIVPHGRGVMEYDPNPDIDTSGMGVSVVLFVKDGEWKNGLFRPSSLSW